MIIFVSDGRLGNQIFQYAFLKSIAKSSEKLVVINMEQLFSTFDIDDKSLFRVKSRFFGYLARVWLVPYILRPLRKLRLIGHVRQIRNENNTPACEYEVQRGMTAVIWVNTDFFQSERFFDKEKIISALRIKKQHIDAACTYIAQVPAGHEKVFVHVRRGDYTYEVFMGEKGINLPKRYFEAALAAVRKKTSSPFYIFLSDDPSYVEDCLSNFTPCLISRNSLEVDLAIMSLCDAGIISNSSFSWWGSALMKNPMLIIAPKYWYGWKQRVDSHPGIYPSNALVIDFAAQ